MPIASKNINAEKIQGNLDITTVSASAFTGSFIGDGAGLYNLPTGSLLTTASFNAYTGSNTSQFAGTASFAYSSSDAITASYYAETDPIFTAVSGTFTTTASFEAFTGSIQPQVDALIAATSSYVQSSQTASMTVLSSSYAQTASNILGGKATHVPYFITDTTLATSSIYQSGSTSVIINQDNNTTANPEALYVWQPSTTSINVISGKGNLNNYLQLNIQNTNQGPDASSDIVATANNGSETDNYIDMGINSQNYAGFLGGPNDSYLYSHGQNMWFGNINDGHDIIFFNSSSQEAIIKLTAAGQAEITGSLFGTASWARNAVSASTTVTASYAILAENAKNAVSASHATNSMNSLNAISASHALLADNALAANYAASAGNGGVTQLIAGSGVTLLPPSGLGNVTVIATGTGGVTIISGSIVTGSFTNTTSYTFNHNLGIRTPIITVFDSNYNQIIPQNIQLVDTASAIITFPTLESGFAIGSTGGTTGTALSSSYSTFSTYADTASYFAETDPVFVARSASLATTGSNTFRGNQTISGSVTITGSLTVSGSSTFTKIGPSIFSGSVTLVNGATGSLFGTSSFAITASYALNVLSASYAQTSSYALQVLSASYALTSSYATFAETASSSLNAQDILIYVLNQSGQNIAKGVVVHITASGNSSDIPRIITASYENDSNSANTLGVTNQAIANGGLGYVMTEGVLRGIDTSNFQSGQLIYLGATGSIIGTAPVAPLHAVRLGQVVREQSNNGSVYVRVDNGYEIGELHDVRDTTTTSSFGDLLIKSGSVWTNSKQLTGSYGITGSLTISGSSTFTNIGPAVFTGSVNITGSTTQTGNNTLIGNTTLSGSIDVSGSQTFNGTSSFYGNHLLSGSNTIRGNTFMFGNIQVSGSSNFNNSEFIVTGSTSILGNFNVKGTSVFSDTTFTVTGSQYFTGSSFINGNQTLTGNSTVTGSLNVLGNINVVSGSSFTRWGNKLFNYGQFAHTASIPVTANVSASFVLPLTYFNDGVRITSGSRITFENTGLYNIQYSAIANQGVGSPTLRLWFRKTGSNIDNSTSIVQLQNNSQTALTYNFAFPFNANEYVELWYQSSTANTSFPYTAAGNGFPASPSIILTVTQIA